MWVWGHVAVQSHVWAAFSQGHALVRSQGQLVVWSSGWAVAWSWEHAATCSCIWAACSMDTCSMDMDMDRTMDGSPLALCYSCSMQLYSPRSMLLPDQSSLLTHAHSAPLLECDFVPPHAMSSMLPCAPGTAD